MIPKSIRAGDSLLIATDLSTSYPQYSAGAGYVLTLTLVGKDGKYELLGTGTPWTFQATAAVTALWVPDTYVFILAFSKTGERHTVTSGTVTIQPDISSQQTFDGRTQAQRTLEAIEAVIEKRASTDQKQYTIQGRSLVKMDVAELFKIRDMYRMEVMREKRQTSLAAGIYMGGNALWARL